MKLEELLNFHKPVPIIFDSDINGLGAVRSFGEEGISTIVIDNKRGISFYSKYAKGMLCPDPAHNESDFVLFLISLGKSLKNKGFIIATSDKYLIAISKNQAVLEQYYIFPMLDWVTLSLLIDKQKLYKIASNKNIPHPSTLYFKTIEEVKRAIESLPIPCVLKPSIPIGFQQALGEKVLFITNDHDLKKAVKAIENTNFKNTPFIVQEYIPGDVADLYTITSYTNKNSKILSYSIGHKIRQNPPIAGSITAGKVVHEPEILKIAQDFMSAVNFYGLSNIEFKRDDRDGSYKLMEINPRLGVWNYSAKASGINLPLAAYNDIVDNQWISQTKPGKELVWINTLLDLYKSLYGFKAMGYNDYKISFLEWLKSIKGAKVDAVYNSRDLIPIFKYIYELSKRLFNIENDLV